MDPEEVKQQLDPWAEPWAYAGSPHWRDAVNNRKARRTRKATQRHALSEHLGEKP